MYVSHMTMLVAGIGIALPCAIPTSSLLRKLARPAAFRRPCRAIRGKRLAGGASPSTDFIHLFRTSMSVPEWIKDLFWRSESGLDARTRKRYGEYFCFAKILDAEKGTRTYIFQRDS